MARASPPSPEQIEAVLTAFYLRADGEFGAAPITFIDAAPEELARALPTLGDTPDEVYQAFLASFNRDRLHDALTHALAPKALPGSPFPGWFRYLVLTCLIASINEEISAFGQFRHRLQEAFPGYSYSTLTGIPKLWKRLQRWLADRRSAGEPFRQLKLPDPGRMNQIGHSVLISFPSRRDRERMDRVFTAQDHEAWSKPAVVFRVIQDELTRKRWSPGFQAAFEDFQARYRQGHRLLASHPFWIVVQSLRRQTKEAPAQVQEARIELATDIEGDTIFTLTTNDASVLKAIGVSDRDGSDETIVITVEQLIALVTRKPPLIAVSTIAACAAEGAIPFEETGFGAWRATRHPASAHVRLLLHPEVIRRYGRQAGTPGIWFLTDRLKAGPAISILDAIRPASGSDDEIRSINVARGIRIGPNYLGRPAFLPVITGTPDSRIDISPAGSVSGELRELEQPGTTHRLIASSPLRGTWTIVATEGGEHVDDLDLHFVPDAAEHDFTHVHIDSTKWREELEIDQSATTDAVCISSNATAAATAPTADVEDLLEALYAAGEHGFSEPRLYELLGDPLQELGISIWDALRVLSESRWLTPRLSKTWGARKWFLVPPRLLALDEGTKIILDGAACQTTRERFVSCVERAGGRVEQRALATAWSIPTIVAFLDNPTDLSDDTGLPYGSIDIRLPLKGSVALALSAYSDRSHAYASQWSWTRGRFLKSAPAHEATIVLERLEQRGGRSNDLYRVSRDGAPGALFDSRISAITVAHQLAERPLFQHVAAQNAIVRIAAEGALPSPIGTYLRYKHLVGPGLVRRDERQFDLVYPADDEDVARIRQWIGPAMQANYLDKVEPRASLLSLVLARRRGVPAPKTTPRPLRRTA